MELTDIEECPPWNHFSSGLLEAINNFATLFVVDEGWYVTCSLVEHLPKICKYAKQRGFVNYRTLTLNVEHGYLYDNGEEVKIQKSNALVCMIITWF